MTSLMGIVNVTPDSFSDGGCYTTVNAAYSHIQSLVNDGASIIDIGAESTRPGACILSDEEEWERLAPLFDYMKQYPVDAIISLDSYHANTIIKALETGVTDWVNDVSASMDKAVLDAVRAHNATLIVMHNRGIPADPQHIVDPAANVTEEVYQWLEDRIEYIGNQDVDRSQIVADIGIGFGKNAPQSIQLLKEIDRFHALRVPLLVGHSRKSFFQDLTGNPKDARDCDTAVVSCYLAQKEVDFLRVHDIRTTKNALHIMNSLL